jgi:pimeloyl-ACP methyl ester carboxylesterase
MADARSPIAVGETLQPTEPDGRATTADGVGIAYYDLGGTGPPLLLAHATGFCGPTLAPMAAHLRSQFHCITLDERAHGASDPPPGEDFDWHGFALDVLAVIDHLGLARPFGFGHSCGGAALLLAEEARPGTFDGLYCFEPVVYPGDDPLAPTTEGNPLAASALRRRREFGSRQQAMANFAGKAPFDRLHPDALAAYVDNGFAPGPGGAVQLRCLPEHEAQVYAHALSHDTYARLTDVHCPVVLTCGSETDSFGPELLEALARRLRAASVVVLTRLGHFGPLEDPAAVAESVQRRLVPVTGTPGA